MTHPDKDKLVAGLDIGSTKVSAVVGRINQYGSVEVLGMGQAPTEGVQRGLVSNIDRTAESIRQAIGVASEQSDVNITTVNVSLSGQYIRSCEQRGTLTRPSREDEITLEDVRRLMTDMYRTVIPHGNKIIHVMPKTYTVDYTEGIVDPVGMSGVRLEADYHIVYGHVNAVMQMEKAVRRAGLEIDQIILAPLASSLACLTDEEKEAGVVLVDIGGGTTDVTIFYENIIQHTAVIPYGGGIITQDIRQGCNLLGNQAELLKTRFGVALAEEAAANEVISITGLRGRPPREISVRNLANIIEARMGEIVGAVHSEIILSGLEDRLAAGIVITGGGAHLQKLTHLFEFMTAASCRIGYPTEHLAVSPGFEAVKDPANSTAIGLVLAGFRSLDRRENGYRLKAQQSHLDGQTGSGRPGDPRLTGGAGGNIFRNIFERARTALTSDITQQGY